MESLTLNVKSKEYILKEENREFKIKIILSSDITIEANELDKIKSTFYSNIFSLDSLIKLSRGFKICEDIKEAYDIIEEILEKQKASINYSNENELSLNIKVDLPGGKIQEVNLILNKKEMNKDILIEELVKKVNKLEEENRTLKKDINEIKEKLNLFEKYFIQDIESKKKKEEFGIDSKIITKKEDLEFITKRLINNDENLKNKSINYNLIYRGTRDGDNLINFHSRVDNKRSHLSIIETNNGSKFGVFIEKPLKQIGSTLKDNKAFIFSLNLKKIYNADSQTDTLHDNIYYIIDLYAQPFRIVENYLTNDESYVETKVNANCSFIGFEKDFELNNGEQNFKVKELETFVIEFK